MYAASDIYARVQKNIKKMKKGLTHTGFSFVALGVR